MRHLRLLLCAVIFIALTGCNSNTVQPPSPTPAPILPQSTATSPAPVAITSPPDGGGNSGEPVSSTLTVDSAPSTPSATVQGSIKIPTPSVPPGQAITATMVAQLQATAIAGVDPTSTPDANGLSPFAGIDGISVLRLHGVPINGEYWLAYSTGSRRLDNLVQQHFVIAFKHENNTWEEVSRIALDNPDYMSASSIMQADIEPSHAWLTVDSGIGAHGGCFDLISFDGKRLSNEVSGCSSGPGAGTVEDLDGDGKGEVVLNASDNYVFCYACGVRKINFSVLRWDGKELASVQAQDLPEDTPTELKTLNNRAVELFTHELMKDALTEIEQAAALDSTNNTVKWNRVLIKLHADARREHVRESNYPLLTNIFYGDYPAAVNVLRPFPIDQVMSRSDQSPLIKGTPAEGNADSLVSYITSTTTLALEAEPDLAPAYFLQGWAYYLSGNHDAEALADLQKAASLNPSDTLFTESLKRLTP